MSFVAIELKHCLDSTISGFTVNGGQLAHLQGTRGTKIHDCTIRDDSGRPAVEVSGWNHDLSLEGNHVAATEPRRAEVHRAPQPEAREPQKLRHYVSGWTPPVEDKRPPLISVDSKWLTTTALTTSLAV